MDTIQEKHERAVGDAFIDWYNKLKGTSYKYYARGTDPPDLIYRYGREELLLEITVAYYDAGHATMLWQNARDLTDAPDSWSSKSPDQKLIDSVNVGSDPGKLALADDGSYLYVALDGASKVIRINLATFAVDLEIPIAPVKARAAFAGDIAVMPGQPTTIAVARRFQGLSPPGAGVAIYDGAVMRADTTPDHIGEDSIVFGSATTLYGSDLCCSGNEFYVVDITATGATRALKVSGLGGQPLELFRNDRVFGSRGRVVDVSGATPVIDGTLATETMLTGGIGALDYLASNSRVYLAGTTGASILIEQFNPDTYVKTRTFTVEPGFDDPIDLAVLGEDSFMVVARPRFGVNQLLRVQGAGSIQGSVTDRHTGERVGGICVDVSLFGDPDTIVASTTTNTADPFSIALPPGTYQVSYIDCQWWDYAAEWYGTDLIEQIVVTSGAATDASFPTTRASAITINLARFRSSATSSSVFRPTATSTTFVTA